MHNEDYYFPSCFDLDEARSTVNKFRSGMFIEFGMTGSLYSKFYTRVAERARTLCAKLVEDSYLEYQDGNPTKTARFKRFWDTHKAELSRRPRKRRASLEADRSEPKKRQRAHRATPPDEFPLDPNVVDENCWRSNTGPVPVAGEALDNLHSAERLWQDIDMDSYVEEAQVCHELPRNE